MLLVSLFLDLLFSILPAIVGAYTQGCLGTLRSHLAGNHVFLEIEHKALCVLPLRDIYNSYTYSYKVK